MTLSCAFEMNGSYGWAPPAMQAVAKHIELWLIDKLILWGQEPAHGMRLPPRRLHQLFGRYAARSLQQVEDGVGLAALAAPGGFGRFLGRGGLLNRTALLPPNVGALWRDTSLFASGPKCELTCFPGAPE
jgi:hypothetical protein